MVVVVVRKFLPLDGVPPTYEAMNFEQGTATETADLAKDEVTPIKDGTFTSQEHDIYYRDVENDIRLHVRATYSLNEDTGEFETQREIQCSGGRGLDIGAKPMRFELPFVHKIIVQGAKTVVSTGTYIISVQDNGNDPRLTTELQLDDKSANGSLKTGIPDETIDTLMFYKFENENFEIRGKLADLTDAQILAMNAPITDNYVDTGATCEPKDMPVSDVEWEALVAPPIAPPEVFIRINYEELVPDEDKDPSDELPEDVTEAQ